MTKKKGRERTIAEIKADKKGRTKEEVIRLDEANTRKSKLYKSIIYPEKKGSKPAKGNTYK